MSRPTAAPKARSTRTVVAVALSGAFLAMLGAGLVVRATTTGVDSIALAGVVPLLVAQVVGLLLTVRRPDNRVGWIVCALAWTLAAQMLLAAYAERPDAAATTWGLAAVWLYGKWFLLLWAGIIALFFHFPDGRLPSPRWRWPARGAAAGLALGLVSFALAPRPLLEDRGLSADNPLNPTAVPERVWQDIAFLEPLALSLLLAGLVASVASLVVRHRRSSPVQRLQIRWVVTAAVVLGALLLVNVAVRHLSERWLELADVTTGVARALLPLSVGVAVLRYRLYEIDRLLSRTVSWLAVTVIVAAVYVGGVSLLTATVAPGDSPLAVAAATLTAAAVFRPTRGRIQRAVDRRFNRLRYDAKRTVEDFSARLRDEVDIATLKAELVRVVSDTMHPAGATLWLREVGR